MVCTISILLILSSNYNSMFASLLKTYYSFKTYPFPTPTVPNSPQFLSVYNDTSLISKFDSSALSSEGLESHVVYSECEICFYVVMIEVYLGCVKTFFTSSMLYSIPSSEDSSDLSYIWN